MLYHSLNNDTNLVTFEQAVLNGISSDGHLYVPKYIPKLDPIFFRKITSFSQFNIATSVIKPYIGNTIPNDVIYNIVKNTINFPLPLKNIHDNIYALELFHGPTLAFKDIGAKFMAECLSYFCKKIENKITVLVATSGDTGGAVARGFYNKIGIEVVILYPYNRISPLQEKQITSLGSNIFALEINGNFDDCQNMVKKAFLDNEIKKKYTITSANSINVARWLPQMFYYFFSYKEFLNKFDTFKLNFSVPSGNFGNICAGMLAEKMGLPVKVFIASTNINDTIPRFIKSGNYSPTSVKKTISNAMDISDPSNFPRILNFLYKKNINKLKKKLYSYKFTDKEVLNVIGKTWNKYKYVLDPHGAIGYLGIIKYLQNINNTSYTGIFLETAHPIKFIDNIPSSLRSTIFSKKETHKHNMLNLKNINKKISIKNNFNEFKDWLLNR
ncbi:threonine synthase [Blattabacterium cuenoti]|uniref:threonine synthase n=1 Tax=Blattabacterium cuenoti TaxID=1653831 RepID=UPI00163BC0DA|nr:threonine synthase [Blattabacterium cuenoti]